MSIVTQNELFQTPPTILPQKIITDNYERVFNDVRFQKGVINSVVIAGFTTVLCLSIGSIAAYAIARIKFLLKVPVQGLVLAIAFFPGVAILVPLFLQFTSFGIVNTYWAMIIPDFCSLSRSPCICSLPTSKSCRPISRKRPGSTVARPGRRSGK